MEHRIPEEIFAAENSTVTTEAGIVPEGYYTLRAIQNTVSVKRAKASGNRYLQLALVASENEAGNRVKSKILNKIVMFEGTTTKGQPNLKSFVETFQAFGFDQDDINGLYASLMENLPSDSAIEEASYRGVPVQLSFGVDGEPLQLKGLSTMGSIKEDSYDKDDGSTVVLNRVGKLWAAE